RAVMAATCISAAIGSITMGLMANYPFALAPGMGLNAFFTYSVVLGMGLSWQSALAAVFISGVLFILLTMTKAREAIINSIPMSLKLAVGTGIGLFIAFIGFKLSKLIVEAPPNTTLVMLGDMKDPAVLLAVFGLVITTILIVKKVNGALLLGIFTTTVVGMIFKVTPSPASLADLFSAPPSLAPTFGQFINGFSGLMNIGLIPVIFSFAFVDVFDTLGTLIGVASKAKMLDSEGKLPRVNKALMADAIALLYLALF
ncbi:MAG: NCS2 family permease, partial [bacterium]|nr:NCS2 family permease [bacterium]